MTLTLSPEVEAAIAEQIRDHHFGSPEDVVALGVHLVSQLSNERFEKLEALNRDIAEARQAVAEGRYGTLEAEDIMQKGRQILAERNRA